ncbi:2824_t:CDS:2 [Entrophospora sp. SA101]|nr:2824_t:CDS:2 [Entrophospora sp. SA101]
MLKREDVSEESKEGPVISVEEGRKVLENAKKSLEQEFATEKDVKYVKELIKWGYKRGMTVIGNKIDKNLANEIM